MIRKKQVVLAAVATVLLVSACAGGSRWADASSMASGSPGSASQEGTGATGTPSTGAPSTGAPSTDAPSTGTPSTDAPSTGSPSTDAPSTGTPSTGSPSMGSPSTGAPSTGSPPTGTPSTGSPPTGAPSTGSPSASTPAIVPTPGSYGGAIHTLQPSAPGTVTYSDGVSTVDASNAAQGYVMFTTAYSGGARLKLQVRASATYNYDVVPGQWYTLPLQMGNGSYELRLMENTTGTKYRQIFSQTVSVSLASALLPYLYPNAYVTYTDGSAAVRKGFDLCVNASTEAQKVAAVFAYVTEHIQYDSAKAATVTAGYLPSVDATLASGKGICFDYAALVAAMLRAQGIPVKLAIGTRNGLDHAWNYIYLSGTGWIAVGISFSGGQWNFTDATFDAAGSAAEGGYATLRVY